MRDRYSYKLSDCDVSEERRSVLEAFRAKRLLWLSWIETDKRHAV
jgi:hypothetical protein